MQSGPERSLAVANATPKAGRATWTTLDSNGEAIQGDPGDFTFSVAPIDRRIGDFFLIQMTNSREGSATIRGRYLVRRTKSSPRYVCSFPQTEVEAHVSIAELTPSPVVVITADAEQARFIVGKDDVCRLAIPEVGNAPSGDLVYRSTLAQGNMFRAMGRWDEAGDWYQRALRLRPGASGGERIATWAIFMRSNFFDLQCTPKEGDLRKLPIDGLLKKRFEAYDDYLARFPATDLANKWRFRKASDLQLCGYLEEARELYREVLERAPDSELAPYAREHRDALADLIRQRDQKLPAAGSRDGGPGQARDSGDRR